MTDEQDQAPSPDHGRRRLPLVVLVLAAVVAAVVAVRFAVPLFRSSETPAPAPAVTAAKPLPPPTAAPPAAAPSAPAAATPAEPRARTRKAPAPAPRGPETPAAPAAGELRIDSDVPGAMVFLDRKYVGTTPVAAKDVAPGSHHLNLTAEGYEGYSQAIDVAAGPADVMVRFKEVRLSESVDVVHKHAMGSCEGRLVADPQGVRYETTNKGDAFLMRFADIEAFDVDYLKKNLHIKRRGGRSYNFTTKAENADPLFVFHRNVEKVRQQLAGGTARK